MVIGMIDQAKPLIIAIGVSNRKAVQNDVPVISHMPGVKYNSFGLNIACMSMISARMNTMNKGILLIAMSINIFDNRLYLPALEILSEKISFVLVPSMLLKY